eukprot:GDKI01028080.1.p1 GENE.GDKI01028080.1~~GDKI01028080.1.p1  ORF type:complete len:462 (-),score=86.55 GDKI01028080.1:31-1296(-)
MSDVLRLLGEIFRLPRELIGSVLTEALFPLQHNSKLQAQAAAVCCVVVLYCVYKVVKRYRNGWKPRTNPLPASMHPQYIVNKQRLWLHTRRWLRSHNKEWCERPRGVIFIVHGFGEHCGRYEHVARDLASRGFDVYSMDHQGHGLSDANHGAKGYFSRLADVADDYIQFIDHVQATEYPHHTIRKGGDIPVFLLGHSWGGLISIHVAKRDQERFNGVAMTGPLLKGTKELEEVRNNNIVRPALLALSRIAPCIRFKEINIDTICHLPIVREVHTHDPLILHDEVPIGAAREHIEGSEEALAFAHTCVFPMLVLHGEQDDMTQPEGSRAFFDSAASTDKTYRLVPGGYHEIMNEAFWRDILAEIVHWYEARLPGTQGDAVSASLRERALSEEKSIETIEKLTEKVAENGGGVKERRGKKGGK